MWLCKYLGAEHSRQMEHKSKGNMYTCYVPGTVSERSGKWIGWDAVNTGSVGVMRTLVIIE